MSCSICLEDFLENSSTKLSSKPSLSMASEERIAFQVILKSSIRNCSKRGCLWGWIKRPRKTRFNENDVKDNPFSIVSTKCGHIYHLECIVAWYIKCNKCPTCRKQVKFKHLTKLHFEINPSIQHKTDEGVLVTITMNQYKALSQKASEAQEEAEKLKHVLENYKMHADKMRVLFEKLKVKCQFEALRLEIEEKQEIEKLKIYQKIMKPKIETSESFLDWTDGNSLEDCRLWLEATEHQWEIKLSRCISQQKCNEPKINHRSKISAEKVTSPKINSLW